MKILATKPVTARDKMKRAIAVVLDDAFISIGKRDATGKREGRDYRLNVKDFDELVDLLENAVNNRIHGNEPAPLLPGSFYGID